MGTARVTFVIDEKGIIEDIIDKVDTRNHVDQILESKITDSVRIAVKKSLPAKKSAKTGVKTRRKKI